MPVLLWFLFEAQADRIDAAIAELVEGTVEAREEAARRLIEIDAPALPRLEKALRNAGPEARPAILDVFVQIRFAYEVAPFILKHHRGALAALVDGSSEERMAALESLREVLKCAIPLCRRLLLEGSPEARKLVASAIVRSPVPEAAPEYIKALQGTDREPSEDCNLRDLDYVPEVRALRECGRGLADRIVTLLSSPDALTRLAAAFLVGCWNHEPAVGALRTALGDTCRAVRVMAAKSLAAIGDPAMKSEWEKLVQGEDLLLRLIAARALGPGSAGVAAVLRDAKVVLWSKETDWRLWQEAAVLLLEAGTARDAAMTILSEIPAVEKEQAYRPALEPARCRHGEAAILRAGVDLGSTLGNPEDLFQEYRLVLFSPIEAGRLASELLRRGKWSRGERLFVIAVLRYGTSDPWEGRDGFVLEVRRLLASQDLDLAHEAAEYLDALDVKEAADEVLALYLRAPRFGLVPILARLSEGRLVARPIEDLKSGKIEAVPVLLPGMMPWVDDDVADYLLSLVSGPLTRANLLAARNTPASTKALRQMLEETKNEDVASLLIGILAGRKDEASIPAIRRWMDRCGADVVEALVELGDRSISEELVKLAAQDGPGAPVAALEGLVRFRHPQAALLARGRLHSRELLVRWHAAEQIQVLGDTASAELIYRVGLTENWPAFIRVLGTLDREKARRLAFELLDIDSNYVLSAFIHLAEPADVAKIAPYLDEPAAVRVLEAAFMPRSETVVEFTDERIPISKILERFGCKATIESRCDETLRMNGRFSLLDALDRLPNEIAWIREGERLRIVRVQDAIDQWKRRLGR